MASAMSGMSPIANDSYAAAMQAAAEFKIQVKEGAKPLEPSEYVQQVKAELEKMKSGQNKVRVESYLIKIQAPTQYKKLELSEATPSGEALSQLPRGIEEL